MNARSLANQEEQQPQQNWQQQQSQQRSQQQQQPEERTPQQLQQQPQQCLLQRPQQLQQRLQQQPQQISIFISDDEDAAHFLALLHRKLIGVKLKSKIQQQVNKSDGFWGTLKKISSRNKSRQYTFRGATELKQKGIFVKAYRDTQASNGTALNSAIILA
ncbi:hypothetical protein SLA2020_146470 [Shorea laevis]